MSLKRLFCSLYLLCLLSLSPHQLFAVIIGSNTGISRSARVTFPAIDSNNEIRGFTYMEKGFALQDLTTSCTFNALFPVSGDISLNSGTLYLTRDLMMSNVTTFTNLGHITGVPSAVIDFAPGMNKLGSGSGIEYMWRSVQLQLHSNMLLDSVIIFNGNSIIDGFGSVCELSSTAAIVVAPNSTLTLKNLILKGVSMDQIRCLSSNSSLVLDNVTCILDGDYTFAAGSMLFKNINMLSGDGFTFAYQTDQASLIDKNGTLIIDMGLTFSYDPTVNDQTLLRFQDGTSILSLNGGTLRSTVIGMALTIGQLQVTNHSKIASEVISGFTGGITWGDDVSNDDFMVTIQPGTLLHLTEGCLNYRNINDFSFVMGNVGSKIVMESGTTLNLYETLNLGVGFVVLGDGTFIGRALGKDLIGSIEPLGSYYYTSL